ncbi:hypothetical protein ACFX16_044974 [Malus domestica]
MASTISHFPAFYSALVFLLLLNAFIPLDCASAHQPSHVVPPKPPPRSASAPDGRIPLMGTPPTPVLCDEEAPIQQQPASRKLGV